mmetsp:Transcript_18196/g.51345  ORF Transcript_18196/g.51345 Transcript_18196/m.51345 type:complete len:273 (+) Transcript_18196:3-821(+)
MGPPQSAPSKAAALSSFLACRSFLSSCTASSTAWMAWAQPALTWSSAASRVAIVPSPPVTLGPWPLAFFATFLGLAAAPPFSASALRSALRIAARSGREMSGHTASRCWSYTSWTMLLSSLASHWSQLRSSSSGSTSPCRMAFNAAASGRLMSTSPEAWGTEPCDSSCGMSAWNKMGSPAGTLRPERVQVGAVRPAPRGRPCWRRACTCSSTRRNNASVVGIRWWRSRRHLVHAMGLVLPTPIWHRKHAAPPQFSWMARCTTAASSGDRAPT